MQQVHVVACGNELCGDDAAGPLLLRRLRDLQARGEVGPAVRLTVVGLAVASWRDLLRGDDRVIFVDAVVGANVTQTVQLRKFSAELLVEHGLEHGLHPLRQFALEQLLYPQELPGDVWLCLLNVPSGAAGPLRTPGAPPTPEARAGVEEAELILRTLLRKLESEAR